MNNLSRRGHEYAYRVVSNLIMSRIIEIAAYHCLSSYHHVFKMHWLGGKRNWCADHLVHTLVLDLLPDYEICCDWQKHEIDGADLATKRHQQILVQALEMSADAIWLLGNECFYVRSAVDLAKMYLVNLSKDCSSDMSKSYLIDNRKGSCNCPDWPRVQLCKHIAAITHYFAGMLDTRAAQEPVPERSNAPHAMSLASDVSAVPILENLISVSRELLSDGPLSLPGTVWSLWLVESHLMAIAQSSQDSQSPLPDREILLPIQHTWTETAKQMGTKHQKRSHPTDAPVPATKQIGNLNRKQPCVRNTDSYSGSLWSGKDAAPDAQTAAQNANARAHTAAVESLPTQPAKQHCKHTSSPPPPPPLAPLLGPSTPLAWYPPHAYPVGVYQYPAIPFWPYGQLPLSQPYYPNTQ